MPFSCKVCGGNRLLPVVYSEDLGICDLGWAVLGSMISETPDPLWYCSDCRQERLESQLVRSGTLKPGSCRSLLLHRKVVKDLLRRYSQTTPDQRKRLRGRRWFEMICMAFSHDPKSIDVVCHDEKGVIFLQYRDRVAESPHITCSMFKDLHFYLDSCIHGPARVGQIEFQGRNIECCIIADQKISLVIQQESQRKTS